MGFENTEPQAQFLSFSVFPSPQSSMVCVLPNFNAFVDISRLRCLLPMGMQTEESLEQFRNCIVHRHPVHKEKLLK
jgi:hypothetical protein